MITITLRNISDTAFWVSKLIQIVRWPGAFGLRVFDAEGKPVPGEIARAEGTLEVPEDVDLFQEIRETHLILLPGAFLGLSQSLKECGFDILAPGRYELRAIYGDVDLAELVEPKRLEKAKEKLKLPIWSGYIESTTVWIRVVK